MFNLSTGGRLSYHGKNEVFKGNQTREEALSNIIAKVEVLNLQDYSKVPQENKFATDVYVCRQNYDMDDKEFTSEIEPDCFCNRVRRDNAFRKTTNLES